MTRPIYEPTMQRTAARLNYGQEQLFRRPAPSGTPMIPMLRAISDADWRSTPIVVPNNTGQDLIFKFWQISDATIFEAPDDGKIDDHLYVWRGLVPGLYLYKAAFELDADPGVEVEVFLTLFTDMVGGPYTGGMYPFYDEIIGPAPVASNNSFFFQSSVSIPPFDPEGQAIDPTDPPTGWEAYLQFYVITSDASSVNLEYARLEVFYMGAIDWESPSIS